MTFLGKFPPCKHGGSSITALNSFVFCYNLVLVCVPAYIREGAQLHRYMQRRMGMCRCSQGAPLLHCRHHLLSLSTTWARRWCLQGAKGSAQCLLHYPQSTLSSSRNGAKSIFCYSLSPESNRGYDKLKTWAFQIVLKWELQALPSPNVFWSFRTEKAAPVPRSSGARAHYTCEGMGIPTGAKQKLSESRPDVCSATATLPREDPRRGWQPGGGTKGRLLGFSSRYSIPGLSGHTTFASSPLMDARCPSQLQHTQQGLTFLGLHGCTLSPLDSCKASQAKI